MPEIKIHCKFDDLIPVAQVELNPYNNNKHPTDQIERLARLIKYQGVRHPIIISNLSKRVCVGEGRFLAMVKAGMKDVPVEYQDFDSDEQEYAFLTSDNAIAQWAEIDLKMINEYIPNLGPDFDLEMLGMEDLKLDMSEKISKLTDDQLGDILAGLNTDDLPSEILEEFDIEVKRRMNLLHEMAENDRDLKILSYEHIIQTLRDQSDESIISQS